MPPNSTRGVGHRLRVAAVALATVCGAGGVVSQPPAFAAAAVAPPSPASATDSSLSALAAQLGMRPAALEHAVRATVLQRWNQIAQANHLPNAVIQEGARRIAQTPPRLIVDSGPSPAPNPLQVAAEQLGLPLPQLLAELHEGNALSQIAEAHGKSLDGLRQALRQAAAVEVSWQAAERGWNSEQQQLALNRLERRIEQWLTSGGKPRPLPGSTRVMHA